MTNDLLRAAIIGVILTVFAGVPATRAQGDAGPTQTFTYPQMNGAFVDWCQSWASGCGQQGADQFCRAQGFRAAAEWTMFYTGRTFVLGSNRFCESASGQCGALREVFCFGFP